MVLANIIVCNCSEGVIIVTFVSSALRYNYRAATDDETVFFARD